MNKVKYVSMRDYVALLGDYQAGVRRLFRGQTCDEPLLPRIARENPKRDTTANEKKMLAELRRRGSLLIGKERWMIGSYSSMLSTSVWP